MFARRITLQEHASVVQKAVAEATFVAQFAGHQKKCEEDKAEIKRALFQQDRDQMAMHAENTAEFKLLHARISGLSWKVIGWVIGGETAVITGAAVVIWALVGPKLGAH